MILTELIRSGIESCGSVSSPEFICDASVEEDGIFRHVCLSYRSAAPAKAPELSFFLKLDFAPDYTWTPHLTPSDGYAAPQHIFRTPALVAQDDAHTVILIPDIGMHETVPYFLDLDVPSRLMTVGRCETEVSGHVLYRKKELTDFGTGCGIGFYLYISDTRLENPFRIILDFFWTRYGRRDLRGARITDFGPYVRHGINWAFDSWKDTVLQSFSVNGKEVGAPVFIVSATQSPSNGGAKYERETRSVWNHAWFSSLRSASGLMRYAVRTGNAALSEQALKTKELALSFTQENGLFDSVAATRTETYSDAAGTHLKSFGWDTLYFGNSDRNPLLSGIAAAPRHILDMAFTCDYMLTWYSELEKDPRLLRYAADFADRLVSLQLPDGYFPAWLDGEGRSIGILDDSPESAMAAAFLLKLDELVPNERYRASALRAIEALSDAMRDDRFEDFETYWSCSSYWRENVGKKIERNNCYKQCNLSIYYICLALLRAYRATAQKQYLDMGQRMLDKLLMTQSSYQPAEMPIPVIGGFGVLNADAELNDQRSSLFAPLILEYGRITGNAEYTERGLAALSSSFYMMYCPENEACRLQWEKKWPFFTSRDYGFMMENYGHNGYASDDGSGIGVFAIYDWGVGAAVEGLYAAADRGYLEGTDERI